MADVTQAITWFIEQVVPAERKEAALDAALTGDWTGVSWLTRGAPAGLRDLPPGAMLDDRYRLGAELGRGGFGVVYEAHDTVVDEPCAVKVLLVSDAEEQERLRREAAVIRLLDLPGVVSYRDDGVHGDLIYLAMERIDGLRFGHHTRRSWSDLGPSAVALFEILCRIHDAGVIHRDLKPSNVLVRPGGRPVVLDFGVSSHSHVPCLDEAGRVAGTPWYLAPELLFGAPANERSDLYALGVMLFEALGGEPPHAGSSFQDLVTLRMARTPALSELPDDTPRAVLDAISGMLEPTPAARPASVAEVTAVLRETLAPLPHVPPPGPPGLAQRLAHRLAEGESITLATARDVSAAPLLDHVARHLTDAGVSTVRARPGQEPFSSLGDLVGPLPDDADLATVRQLVRESLAGALSGGVLVGDHRKDLDRWTSELIVEAPAATALRVVDDDAELVLEAWSEQDLHQLFHGPDRLLHLREDGARLLHRRTGGARDRVLAELSCWVRAGLARWEDGAARVQRDTLAQLEEGFLVDPVPALRHRDRPSDTAVELARWLLLAGPGVEASHLARAMGQPAWRIDAALAELETAGVVRRRGGEVVSAGAVIGTRWSATERLEARRRLVAALPPGSPSRLAHLVALGELDGLVEEMRHRIAHAHHAQALAGQWSALMEAHALTRRHRREDDADHFLDTLLQIALERFDVARLGQLAHVARRARRPHRAALALTASGAARARAQAIDDLDTLELPRSLERWRWTVKTYMAGRQSLDARETLVDAFHEEAEQHDDEWRSAALAARAQLAYAQRAFGEAAALNGSAAELAGSQSHGRHAFGVNGALALLEAGDPERAATVARELLPEVVHARMGTHEALLLWVIRSAAYRRRQPPPDTGDLDRALPLLDIPWVTWMHRFVSAAEAWRDGRPEAAAGHLHDLPQDIHPPSVTALSRAFLATLTGEVDPELEDQLREPDLGREVPGLIVQAAAMAVTAGVSVDREVTLGRLRALGAPALASPWRRELLDVDEILGRLGLTRAEVTAPSPT